MKLKIPHNYFTPRGSSPWLGGSWPVDMLAEQDHLQRAFAVCQQPIPVAWRATPGSHGGAPVGVDMSADNEPRLDVDHHGAVEVFAPDGPAVSGPVRCHRATQIMPGRSGGAYLFRPVTRAG
jgi:hypothetical protein